MDAFMVLWVVMGPVVGFLFGRGFSLRGFVEDLEQPDINECPYCHRHIKGDYEYANSMPSSAKGTPSDL